MLFVVGHHDWPWRLCVAKTKTSNREVCRYNTANDKTTTVGFEGGKEGLVKNEKSLPGRALLADDRGIQLMGLVASESVTQKADRFGACCCCCCAAVSD